MLCARTLTSCKIRPNGSPIGGGILRNIPQRWWLPPVPQRSSKGAVSAHSRVFGNHDDDGRPVCFGRRNADGSAMRQRYSANNVESEAQTSPILRPLGRCAAQRFEDVSEIDSRRFREPAKWQRGGP
jgi:hypothetical protein